ncbi:MAG: ABC transporter ATP-binding protein [Chlamydiia bacterium]|nr:ABC transporter ATP-binding protein [Chlamydiia bacterium]MCP5509653.1 ABC transporter ATP-binding protein [Chlamydiales bacterium]
MIELQNINFAYENTPILKNVNLKIESGEYVGIIGPNGGGKTTLLKLILGFLKPTSGTIHIDDQNLAYVPQQRIHDRKFPISVLELVGLGILQMRDWKSSALQALEQVGLTSYAHQSFANLSGGQLQRALIARALVSQPKILLLDEPTANLDTSAQEDIHNLLRELKKDMTILMVSHDLQTIIQEVDRILLVQGTVTTRLPKDICEHFAMGLYHKPLIKEETP